MSPVGRCVCHNAHVFIYQLTGSNPVFFSDSPFVARKVGISQPKTVGNIYRRSVDKPFVQQTKQFHCDYITDIPARIHGSLPLIVLLRITIGPIATSAASTAQIVNVYSLVSLFLASIDETAGGRGYRHFWRTQELP